jgi:hypothetical protein
MVVWYDCLASLYAFHLPALRLDQLMLLLLKESVPKASSSSPTHTLLAAEAVSFS